MPELPEVETIVRALRRQPGDHHLAENRRGPSLLGQTFSDARLLWERTLATPIDDFYARLPGQSIQSIHRRGKFIVLSLDFDTLLIHLRMSGDLRVEPDRDEQGNLLPLEPHDRAVFYFQEPLRLAFNDARKFGRIWLTPHPGEVLGGLGIEQFDPALTAERFYQMLVARRRQLKPLLLDQSFIAGLGNIYTDEALHLAQIHPLRPSETITPADADRLLQAVRTVLEEGIRRNGASIDWVYRGGSFQNNFRAYGRTGEPCPVCGRPIERTVVGQRGT
jgi:formamidopyrimidine-DNA glycosylase